MITLGIPGILAMIMFGMGLTLSLDDFIRVFKYPQAALIGTLGQLVALPLIALGLALLWDLEAELAVGLMILSFCPGGVTSNILSHLARADTALSVSLTAISSCITPWTTPIMVNLVLAFFMNQNESIQLPVATTLLRILLITVVPIGIGMVVHSRAPAWSERVEPILRGLGILFLMFMMVGITIKEYDVLPGLIAEAGVLCTTLCLICYTFGYLTSRLIDIEERQRASISIEVGMQNSSLAMVITTSFLENTRMAVIPMVYSIMMFTVGWLVVFWFYKKLGPKS